MLKPLKAIMVYTDDEETTSVAEITDAAIEEGERVEGEPAAKITPGTIQDEQELLQALEDDDEVEERTKSQIKAAAEARLLDGKFVNLTDLIPPIPDKGSFEVENIKESQYFFS
jgi:DNA-directed RNA polymerase